MLAVVDGGEADFIVAPLPRSAELLDHRRRLPAERTAGQRDRLGLLFRPGCQKLHQAVAEMHGNAEDSLKFRGVFAVEDDIAVGGIQRADQVVRTVDNAAVDLLRDPQVAVGLDGQRAIAAASGGLSRLLSRLADHYRCGEVESPWRKHLFRIASRHYG